MENRNDMVTAWDETVKRMAERKGEPPMPTGLADLDRLTWGIHPGELFVISAKTKSGKTSLACQIFWNAVKRGKFGVFLSLEMNRGEILTRICCQEYRVNAFETMRIGRITPEVRVAIDRHRGNCQTRAFDVLDDVGFTADDLLSTMEYYRETCGQPFPDLLVVDHIQRVRPQAGQSMHEAVTQYANACKVVAQEFKCAVVACSQLNRAANDPKWSSTIEEAADTLIKCDWPRNDPTDPNRFEVNVAYNRFGPNGICEVNFVSEHARFVNRAHFSERGIVNEPVGER